MTAPGSIEHWPTRTSFVEQALWEHLKNLGVDPHRYLSHPDQLPLPSPVVSTTDLAKQVDELREGMRQLSRMAVDAGMVAPAQDYSRAQMIDPTRNPHAIEHAAAQAHNEGLQLTPLDALTRQLEEARAQREKDRERARKDREEQAALLKDELRRKKNQRDIDTKRAEFHWFDDELEMTEAHPEHPDHDPDHYYDPDEWG